MKLLFVMCIGMSLVACHVEHTPRKCSKGFVYYKSGNDIWIKTDMECLSNE
jgi:hypothetical protein